MNFFKKHTLFVIALVMFFVFLVLFANIRRISKELTIVERITHFVSQPVHAFYYYSIDFVKNTYQSYIDLKHAKEEAVALKEENTKLNYEIHALGDVIKENESLRQLLGFKSRYHFSFLSCEIMQGDPSFLYKNVTINKGSQDGVVHGMGVVSDQGVVGVIMRVFDRYSDVLLLTDPNSNLDVVIARNRRRGILQGGISQLMEFKYFDQDSSILVGDEILTSGLSGAFPSSIPVGKVVNIKWDANHLAQMVEVEPAVNFAEISKALILLTPNHEVDAIRRIGGSQWIPNIMEMNAGKIGD
jgi:rod shape-determining protein MreC